MAARGALHRPRRVPGVPALVADPAARARTAAALAGAQPALGSSAFAAMFTLHLLCLATFNVIRGTWPDPLTIVGGGAFVALYAMVQPTSNCRAVRLRRAGGVCTPPGSTGWSSIRSPTRWRARDFAVFALLCVAALVSGSPAVDAARKPGSPPSRDPVARRGRRQRLRTNRKSCTRSLAHAVTARSCRPPSRRSAPAGHVDAVSTMRPTVTNSLRCSSSARRAAAGRDRAPGRRRRW